MSEALAAEPLNMDFMGEMSRQIRALDTYGTYDNSTDAEVLDPLIMTKERKREIPIVGDPDDITMSRVKAYYNALAVQIEKQSGLMAVPIVNLSHEGFGRALITVGKLIVVDKSLRDVHRFGFKSLDAMEEEASKLVTKAMALVKEYAAVAKM